MQFVVLLAFAMVIMPAAAPAWPVVESLPAVLAIVAGQWVVIAIWGWIVARRVAHVGLRLGQRRFARAGAVHAGLVLAGLAISMWGTAWPSIVRVRWHVQVVYGLDELVILAPTLIAILVGWWMLYPADRALRREAANSNELVGLPARPPWSRRRYIEFMARHQLLIIAVPMTLIVIANDVVQEQAAELRHATRLFWADQGVLVAIAGVVLLFAPVLLRTIWQTSPLPPGPLRSRLEAVSRRLRLRYREILVWHTEGMVVNAAVMGVVPPVRYVLLSDGLLEQLDETRIEAVFGHEAGHVVHWHIPFYLLFAILSMLIVGGTCELCARALFREFHVRIDDASLWLTSIGLVVVVWGVGFGWISRRFERQADLFGALLVGDDMSRCRPPCHVHPGETSAETTPARETSSRATDGAARDAAPAPEPALATGVPSLNSTPDDAPRAGSTALASAPGVCPGGAAIFADALSRIARLNGIPEEARSWRHSSIASRIRFLHALAAEPRAMRRFQKIVLAIKVVLVVGTLVGLVLAVWLYFDYP